jgi:hypothetical protein
MTTTEVVDPIRALDQLAVSPSTPVAWSDVIARAGGAQGARSRCRRAGDAVSGRYKQELQSAAELATYRRSE